MTNVQPATGDPVLLGGNFVDQPESQWFDNSRRQLEQAGDED